jgi:hypothetical protein
VNTTTLLIVVTLVGLVLPVLSARIVRAHWDASITGLITGALAALVAFTGEWLQAGAAFDWRTAALGTLTAWFTGRQLTQGGILSNTQAEARLLAAGTPQLATAAADSDPTVGLDYDDAASEQRDQVAPHPSPGPSVHVPEHASDN